jgi:sugar-specific transcriptional regulator TrmB
MANLESEIKKSGLSDKEAKVYLALLELGQAPPSEVASYSGVNRATTYVILEELRKRGLATSFEKSKKIHFAAEPPERLKNLFEIEKEKLENNFSDLKNILPDLEKLYESRGERPKVRFFDGIEGIKSIREDIFKTRAKNMEEIVPLDESHKDFPPSKEDHREKMSIKLRGVNFRVIYTSKKGKIWPKIKGINESVKFVKPDFLPLSSEIVLFGNKTIIVVSKKKKFGVVLEDESITNTIRSVFNLLWKNLK